MGQADLSRQTVTVLEDIHLSGDHIRQTTTAAPTPRTGLLIGTAAPDIKCR